MPLISSISPEKNQKNSGSLMFSEGIEKEQWHEMVKKGDS